MIVMKFGGTSVEDAIAMTAVIRIIEDVRQREAEQGYPVPLVVSSACAGITNKLFELGRLASSGKMPEAESLYQRILSHHLTVTEMLLQGSPRLNQVKERLLRLCEELHRVIGAIGLLGEMTPRLSDMIASYGELLSTVILAEGIHYAGLSCEWKDARELLVTDASFGKAKPRFSEIEAVMSSVVMPLLERGTVVVTQGYIGSAGNGATTTLGRGGSDYSAAIFGAALGAREIQIWTDVDGVLTTDPRLVPEARRLKMMTFAEAAELAYFGAKVLHPATIRPAVQKNIPVRVLNSKRPQSQGTRITGEIDALEGTVKSIACKKGQTLINLTSTAMLGEYGFLFRVSDIFMRYETPIDMISTGEISISVTIGDGPFIEKILAELNTFCEVTIENGVSIISVVGDRIRRSPGIAARVFTAIDRVNVKMISQGASEINIGFVVSDDDAANVVRRLHDAFFSEVKENQIFAAAGA